jgi:hypothetical protein
MQGINYREGKPMDVQIDSVQAVANCRVLTDISGVPDTKASYSAFTFSPQWVSVDYWQKEPGVWAALSAKAGGGRVLKPGKDGDRRVSESVDGRASWNSHSRDLADCEDVPEWVRSVVARLRPTGSVFLPVRP